MPPTITDNRTLLAKADLALSDLSSGGGVLVPEQAESFMRLMIKPTVIMRMATVTPMKAPKKQIPKTRFGSRVMRQGAENTALPVADRSKPDFSYVELDSKLLKGQVNLSDEQLEDNIEGQAFKNTILALLGEAVGRDVEELILQGDTLSADLYLATLDGVLKQATSNVVDAAGAFTTKQLWRDMLLAMPSEFSRDQTSFVFFTSRNSAIYYGDTVANRATVLGDGSLSKETVQSYQGINVVPVPIMPENLSPGSRTNALLTHPKNIHVGIWREIRLATDYDVESGTLKIVATLRMDVKYEHEPAVVKGINIAV